MSSSYFEVFSALALFYLVFREPILGGLTYRQRRLEEKLDLLLTHFDLKFEDRSLDTARELAKSGKQTQAIRQVRKVTGLGLKEAKDLVETFKSR